MEEAEEISVSDEESEDANAWSDDLDLGDEDLPAEPAAALVPSPRPSLFSQWCERSSLCADHAAAGDIATAAALLNRQIGVVAHTALLPLYRRVFAAAQPLSVGFPGMPALATPVQRSMQPTLPFTPVTLGEVTALVKKSLKAFQGARFEACSAGFLETFRSVPFVLAGSKQDEALLHQYLDLAREYSLTAALERGQAPGGAASGARAAADVPDDAHAATDGAPAADAARGDGGGVQGGELHRRGAVRNADPEQQRDRLAEERELGAEGAEGAGEEREGGQEPRGDGLHAGQSVRDRVRGVGADEEGGGGSVSVLWGDVPRGEEGEGVLYL